MIYDLTEWEIRSGAWGNYDSPELIQPVLTGVCSPPRKPHHTPGDRVTTSPVVAFDPATQVATTRTGSKYRLKGPPHPAYAAWCVERGHDLYRVLSRALTA